MLPIESKMPELDSPASPIPSPAICDTADGDGAVCEVSVEDVDGIAHWTRKVHIGAHHVIAIEEGLR